MEDNKSGRFRKKKVNFSMISNTIIRDESISLRAKGLYTLIQSYITMETFTLYKSYLMSQCCEGERAFDSAWKELKEKGYLKQYKMRDGARTFYYEYELLDEPETESQEVHSLGVQNVGLQNEDIQSVPPTKRSCINNIIYNNTISNNTISNHIISIEEVKDQIGYDAFRRTEQDQVSEIAMLITEVMNTADNKQIRIAKDNISAAIVKERFRKLDKFHIEYVLECLKQNSSKISSVKNYLLTALYNAPLTMNSYYENRVNVGR